MNIFLFRDRQVDWRSAGLSTSRAFTLIELLVSVAIVGILAAVLTKAAQGALSMGKGAQKIGNLRSIGAAHGIYVADSGGYCLPTHLDNTANDPDIKGNTAWWPYYIARVAPAGSKIFYNPDFHLTNGSKNAIWDDVANRATGKIEDVTPNEYCRIEAGFGWNWYQLGLTPGDQGEWSNGPNNPRPAATVKLPSKLIICMESMSVVAGPNPSIGLNFQAWLNSVKIDPDFWPGPRWSKGGNTCLFFDGHVAVMKPDDFSVENFDLTIQ